MTVNLLTETRKSYHVTPVLVPIHWLPVSFRIHFEILLFAYKALNRLAPSYPSVLLELHVPSPSLGSADQLLLVTNAGLKNRGDRAFAIVALELWKQLPPQLSLAPTLPMFKSHLKPHLYAPFPGPV